ncbi:monooxygenase FAD-binding protein [Trametes polyzona]|nr:monooxygenase FAD-binding protein [Trametes polyzona]
MASQTYPRIAIVGGGPAGLALLLTLHKRGIPATVYERELSSKSRAYLGGMLDLAWESGQRALRENGLEDAFKKNSRRDAEETKVCGKDGVPVFYEPGGDPNDDDLVHARPEIDRRVLREIMIDAVPKEAVQWGHTLVSARPLEGGQHELTFENGVVVVADLVVGADGANSRVRPLLSSAVPIYHGINGAEISITPEVAALPENRDIVEGMGVGSCYVAQEGKACAIQRNGSGRIRCYAWHRDSLDWTLPSDPKEAKKVLLEIYSDWAPWIRKFIQLADENAIYHRPLYHLVVGHRWEHKPGVTALGEAAHLMSPFAGAGANLALLEGLELGLALAESISKGAGKEEREAAIAAWEETMFARSKRFSALTLKNLEGAFGPEAPHAMVKAYEEAVFCKY